MFRNLWSFIKKVAKRAYEVVKSFVKEVSDNLEAAIILTTASIGCTTILSELPLHIALPLWVEGAMFIPFLSVILILSLTYIMQWRAQYVAH